MIVWAEIQSTYLADFLLAIPVFLPHGNVHQVHYIWEWCYVCFGNRIAVSSDILV